MKAEACLKCDLTCSHKYVDISDACALMPVQTDTELG